MKTIFIVTCSFFLALCSFAQEVGVKFETGTLAEALAKAKSNKNGPKMIFVDCYTSWCGPCKMVATKIFPTQLCGDYFNANFICLKMDMEKGEGIEVGKKYKVHGYPTFLILDANGVEINRTFGATPNPELFVEKIKKAVDPSILPTNLLAAYLKNKNLETLFAYLNSLSIAGKYDEVYSFLNTAFFDMSDADKFSPKLWKMLCGKPLINIENPVFKYLLEHRVDAERMVSKKTVDAQILRAYTMHLCNYIRGEFALDEDVLESLISKIRTMSNESYLSDKLGTMARYRKDGKIDLMIDCLVAKDYYLSSRDDQEYVEKSLTFIKNLNENQRMKIANYFIEKAKFLEADSNDAKRTASKFSLSEKVSSK